jgi:hypothetical protein
VTRSVEDPLVAKAFDRRQSHDELARAIAKLSPDEAAFFLHRLEMAMRKRKIQLTGYLVALLAWLAGMVLALMLFYFGGMNGWSAAWVFIVPLGIVGAILYGFGAWAERVARRPPPPPSAPPAT